MEELDDLEISGAYPGRVTVRIELEEDSPIASASLEATNWSDNMNGVFFMESQNLNKETQELNFENVPPGEYTVQLRSKPKANANGSFSINTIKTLRIMVEENETTEVEF